MERIRVAFAGGRSLGVRTLKWLVLQKIFEVIAVCPVPRDSDPEYFDQMIAVINENGLKKCDIQELMSVEVDIGLSVNYHRIIREEILRHCKKGFYNVHHSYNLRLRGRNITTHVLLNTLDENVYYHGTTLHLMVPELDAGGIVASEAVNIEKDDTAYSLFAKTDEKAFDMITEWFPRVAGEKVFLYMPPQEGIHCYKNADLPDREIKEYMSDQEMDVLVRAFDFPGKEPAYIQKDKKKVHVVSASRDQFVNKLVIHDRIYYTD